jgi:hypothetical protein
LPFELNIAVKREPPEQRRGQDAGHGAPCPVTLVEISGDLSVGSAVDLTQRLDDVVTGAPSNVILRFLGDLHLLPDNTEPIEVVAAWLKRRRRENYSVYVEVVDEHAREAFVRLEDMSSVMLPVGANPDVPRRNVDDTPPEPNGRSA